MFFPVPGYPPANKFQPMNIWGKYLEILGWSVEISAPRRAKCVICVAPHTSNWDFILGLAAYRSLGRKANFLMKKFWFFFPLKYLLYHFGGIAVESRKKAGKSLTEQLVEDFKSRDYLNLAVTPEGTRSLAEIWHTGFLYIAYGAEVPIQLGVIDYKNKRIIIRDEYEPTGNVDTDMSHIKKYYSKFTDAARYPEKFSAKS